MPSAAAEDNVGFTTFPLSSSLPNSPVTPEDGTFSILPRYLIQRVKNTFAGAGPAAGGSASHAAASSSASRTSPSAATAPRGGGGAGAPPARLRLKGQYNSGNGSGSGSNGGEHAGGPSLTYLNNEISRRASTKAPASPVLRSRHSVLAASGSGGFREAAAAARNSSDGGFSSFSVVAAGGGGGAQPSGSTPSTVISRSSRNPRLANLVAGSGRRAASPLVSRPLTSDGQYSYHHHHHPHHYTAGASSLSRSHSSTLQPLPESPLDYSPPPAYSSHGSGGHHAQNGAASYAGLPGTLLSRIIDEDDTKSVSSMGAANTEVAQIFRRIGEEVMSREKWVDDAKVIDCYQCKSTFTTWRRKHHCRVCGRIFCSHCASNIVPGLRYNLEGRIRICDFCKARHVHEINARPKPGDSAYPRNSLNDSTSSNQRVGLSSSTSVANLNISLPLETTYNAPQSQFSASVLFPRNDFSSFNLAALNSSDDIAHYERRGRRFSDASVLRPDTPDLFEENASPQPWRQHPAALGSPLALAGAGGSPREISIAEEQPQGRVDPSSPGLAPLTTPAPFRKTTEDEDKPLPSPGPPLSPRPDSPLDEDAPAIPAAAPLINGGLGITNPPTPSSSEPPSQFPTAPGTAEGSYAGSTLGGPGLTISSGRPATPSTMSYLGGNPSQNAIRSRLTSRAADQVFEYSDVDTRRMTEDGYWSGLMAEQRGNLALRSDVMQTDAAKTHAQRLLAQCLQQARVPNALAWEKVLVEILWKVAQYPLPRVSEGDSMDVRQYVKIKRIPGGSPSDSEYVDGVVFTKSLLNKTLPRFIANPRIMLFSYPFEFEQDETRMARLDSLRDSERDSLRKLVNSVVHYRPHVVLVSKNVSGIALEYLHKANIIVARNVKESVLASVARCTQAGIFEHYQHFPEFKKLGRCQAFRSETIVDSQMPGTRKTFMRFEGCSKDLGATILLRGGDLHTLSTIKRIMRFMVLAVYSLRLEKALLWDEQATITSPEQLIRLREIDEHEVGDIEEEDAEIGAPTRGESSQRETAKLVSQALLPYVTTILSTSPTVIFPPPHSLAKLREDNMRIRDMLRGHRQEATITPSSHAYETPGGQVSALAAPTALPLAQVSHIQVQSSGGLTRSMSEASLLSLKPQVLDENRRISAELTHASQIADAEARRDEHLKIWETRLARHKDDLRAVSHQKITFLKTVICMVDKDHPKICDGPHIVRQHFYRPGDDLTLRQYIVQSYNELRQKCLTRACDKPMIYHETAFTHGQLRLTVKCPPPDAGWAESGAFTGEDMYLRAQCAVCESADKYAPPVQTDQTIMSEEAGNYSFAKYLELTFYNDELYSRALVCKHNIHRDYTRFITYKDRMFEFHLDKIDVMDVAVPPLQLRIDAQAQLANKTDEYISVQKAAGAFWDSVVARIHNFKDDVLPFEKKEAGVQAMHEFSKRVIEDRKAFSRVLDKAYEDTPLSRPSGINAARHSLQDFVIAWEQEFTLFEQAFIPTDAERARRATSTQLRRLFSDPDSSVPSSPNLRGSFSPMPSLPSSPLMGPVSPTFGSLSALPPSAVPTDGSSGSSSTPTSSAGSVSGDTSSGASTTSSSSVMLSPSEETAGLHLDLAKIDLPSLTSASHSHPAGEPSPLPDAPHSAASSFAPSSMIDHEAWGMVIRNTSTPADQDADSDSDSTVCADPPRQPLHLQNFDALRSESEDADSGLAMKPFKLRRGTKPTPSIANLVQRFEGQAETKDPVSKSSTPDTPNFARATPSPRPGPRRLKSDYSEVRQQRTRQASGDLGRVSVQSDGDTPADMPTSARTSRYSKSPSKHARPRSPNYGKRRSTIASTGSTASASAPPSRTSSSLAVPQLDVTRPAMMARTSTNSSRSTVTGRETGKRAGSGQDKGTGSDSPNSSKIRSKSSTLKVQDRHQKVAAPRPSPMFAPKTTRKVPPALGAGSISGVGSRVSTMARHFNHLSREAERERQRQMLIARGRRARPVAIARTTTMVFLTSKEAMREDSDDEGGSSSGADDELDARDDGDDEDKQDFGHRNGEPRQVHGRNESAVTNESYIYDSTLVPSSSSDSRDTLSAGVAADMQQTSSQSSLGVTDTDSGPSVPPSPLLSGNSSSTMARFAANMSESEMSSTGTGDRHTFIMKTLSSLWNYRGAGFTPLELPHSDYDHLFKGCNIVLREDEPSSWISYAMVTSDYRQHFNRTGGTKASASSIMVECMPEENMRHGVHRESEWNVIDYPGTDAGTDIDAPSKRKEESVIAIRSELGPEKSGNEVAVKCYFATQFDALRKDCGCENLYIESLARCVKWDPSGGKSGVAFLKSKDDRFIIKELNKAEMKWFADLGQPYFDYMSCALRKGQPTVLAKIFGVYGLSFSNKGRHKKMNVMVMENIYYKKTIIKQFDLKGSTRNRFVEVQAGKNCVLLDENLVNLAHDTPLYVRQHTKANLETALHNDSLFLSKNNIMDYSLIVGIDKFSSEIVVGIVDFLRPYSWDKILESWVKTTGLGSGKGEPTVMNPRMYKNRFREAMARYFVLVPDRWTSADAYQASQSVAALTAPQTARSKAGQTPAEEQQEQYAGGGAAPSYSRESSSTTSRQH